MGRNWNEPTSKDTIDKIVRLRDQGLDWDLISERFGIQVQTLKKLYQQRKDES